MSSPAVSLAFHLQMLMPLLRRFLPISQGVALGWGLIAPLGRYPVSGSGTRGFAAQTVLARDDTEKPHLLPTASAIVCPANTPPLVVADMRSGFNNIIYF